MNQNHVRIIPLSITDLSGAAVLDLQAQGIASGALVVPVVERADAMAHALRVSPAQVRLQVTTYGRTIAPQPWNGLDEPITVKAMAVWVIEDDALDREQVARTWALPAGLSHVIEHNMGTRLLIESVKSLEGSIYAGVTILDENRIQIDLTEAVPVTVSIVFLL